MKFVVKRVDVSNPVTQDIITDLQAAVFSPLEWEHQPRWQNGDWCIAYAKTPSGLAEAGYAGTIPSQTWLDTGFMCSAGVLPEYRGNGLQKRLIKRRIDMARDRGWKWLITYTSADNAGSVNSLISQGFRLYVPKRRWAGSSFCYWRRSL